MHGRPTAVAISFLCISIASAPLRSQTTEQKQTFEVALVVTKMATVLELLRRKEGATIDDIARLTGWQYHSIRGFLSGTVSKKMGLALDSVKSENGERVYRIR